MYTPKEENIITNSDESRRLPDENPEPLEGMKKEESNLLEAEQKKKEGNTTSTNADTNGSNKKEMK